jgi:hypothetical protein
MGVFENEQFAEGTKQMALTLAAVSARHVFALNQSFAEPWCSSLGFLPLSCVR